MALLTIEDIISKKEELKEEAKEQRGMIHCEKLKGEFEAHSLSKGDLADVRAEMKKDAKRGTYKMIYMSIDSLRDPKLLEAYGCTTNSLNIVERLFPRENQIFAITELLNKLNGLSKLDPQEMFMKESEEIKN
ncbi:hypothetical protein U728_1078 [Clostridium botulinum 202F]|nr:hypothetical protein U728_1078 [Clostridium botulinum 202F]KAI3344361.1 hypothetical protein CIT17_17230 [Clostridium botulinum]KON13539.1 hypothetical protein ACP50_05590 [Clostridium botulinum]MBY6988422.1 hypothetical protein [Clostridium botulinum]NFH02057.1 hypothetical protein [Clostridium botulinum]